MPSGSIFARHLAAQHFHRARRQAAVESLLARLSGQSVDLLSYNDVVEKLGVRSQSTAGLQQIPLGAIVGSVGRYQDFTRSFLPRQESDEDRWVSVGAAAPTIGDLPPIDVYKIGDVYFVLDGNHRVSVARQQRVAYIDAYVTDVRTRAPLPPGARPDDLIIAAEYAAFLAYTHLDLIRPGCDLRVSVPGQYAHLENHIEANRYQLETAGDTELSLEDAAARWFDEAYLPMVEAIREQGILRYFPGRTETDFFIWLSRHRQALQRELGQQVSPETAVVRLLPRAQATERAAVVPASPLRRLRRLVVPEQPATPPITWAAGRTLDRYSEHLFAGILLPFAVREASGQMEPNQAALALALAQAQAEEAQLCALAVVDHKPLSPAEQASVERLRDVLREIRNSAGPAANVDLTWGDPTQRAIDMAFINDLVVLDRHFNQTTPDEPAPTAAVRRLIVAAHRPLYVVGETAEPTPRRALLVHDSRRAFDEALFIAAYLAEQWKIELCVLPISNGRNTQATVVRIDDYLQLHEINATFLPPSRPGDRLPAAIVDAAAEHDCDLILLPAPVDPLHSRRTNLTGAVIAVVERWPRAVLIAT